MSRKQTVLLVLVVIALTTCGVKLFDLSHAAAGYVSAEPETGALTIPAQRVTDLSASAGAAIRFAATAQPPANCVAGGNYLWSNLSTCGWPSADNTGPNLSACPGGILAINSGSVTRTITASTANATISCQNITGCLNITAANVTVVNVKIACSSGKTGTDANGTSVINISDGASATLTNVEVNGMSGVHACVWHQGTSATINKLNCYGVNDGVFSWADNSYSQTTGDNLLLQDSYLHDFTVKTANGHIDGYQTEGAANSQISHNTFLMTSDLGNGSDSAVAIWNSLRSTHDIVVTNNLITGGGFAIYAEDYSPSEASPAGGFTLTNVSFTNNKFSTHLFGGSCVGRFGVWFPRGAPSDQWRRSGNSVLETGVNLDGGNPSGCN